MKKKGDYNPGDIGGLYGTAMAIGIINLVLVGLLYLLKFAVIAAGLLLFFMLGFYAVILEIKDGIKEKNMKGLGKGLLGLAINVLAVVLYFYKLKMIYFGS